jgi:hypothetical protein
MRRLVLVLLLVLAAAMPARADDYMGEYHPKAAYPLEFVLRPLTLPRGMLEIDGYTVLINLDAGSVGKPISLAPDVFYGITHQLTVGVHSGQGICLSGSDVCKVFDDLELEARYSLVDSDPFDLTARLGFGFLSFDVGALGVPMGLFTRLSLGQIVAIRFNPSLEMVLNHRDTYADSLVLPVYLEVQATPHLMTFLIVQAGGPLSDFGNYQGRLGVGVSYAISNMFDVGAGFDFNDFWGKNNNLDRRELYFKLALRI